jgi:hypothetical protein
MDSVTKQVTHDGHLHSQDKLSQRHARTFREWAVDLFHLQNANGPSRFWHHPGIGVGLAPPLVIAELQAERDKWYMEVLELGDTFKDYADQWSFRVLRKLGLVKFDV